MDDGNSTPLLFSLLVSLIKQSKNVDSKTPATLLSTQFSFK